MIHYQLQCSADHRFDGWFRDSAAFDQQATGGLVECPVCGLTDVARALMSPALPRKSNTPAPAVAAPLPGPQQPKALSTEHMPDHVRGMLQRLRAEVERNCDYVGERFAEEARRIHRGDSDQRGIYGETTPEQAESLADEGIDVSRIPWVPRADG